MAIVETQNTTRKRSLLSTLRRRTDTMLPAGLTMGLFTSDLETLWSAAVDWVVLTALIV